MFANLLSILTWNVFAQSLFLLAPMTLQLSLECFFWLITICVNTSGAKMLNLTIFLLYSCFFSFCFFTFIWSEALANRSGLVSQGAWIKNPQSIYVFWLFIQKLLAFRSTLVSSFVLLGVGRRFLSATCDSIDSVVTSWQTSFNSIAEMSRKLLWRRVTNPPFWQDIACLL